MTDSRSDSYARAGVDITAGYRAVELMKKHVGRTTTAGVVSGLGGFGGVFAPDLAGMEKPLLVSGTDGVGTKLKLAFYADKHDTIGIDCVAMCVNDIICAGARPLFFLDYIACGKNVPERIEQIVAGVAEGCVQAGAALIGGETAEMPGFYPEDEYDLAGFAVGVVDEKDVLDPARVDVGDVIIGLASSGVHSNGFSLVRKVFGLGFETSAESDTSEEETDAAIAGGDVRSASGNILTATGIEQTYRELGGSLVDTLLEPTKIYVKPVLDLLDNVSVKAISHITGGGLYENLPRAIPSGLGALIDVDEIPKQPIFDIIAREGNISDRDMYNTFNMGLGMAIVVAPRDVDVALASLEASGEPGFVVGQVTDSPGVEIRGISGEVAQ